MIRRLTGILLLLATLGVASNSFAHTTECDWVAGHTTEPERQAPGVPPRQINYKGAAFACERDLKADPNNIHLMYELGHLLWFQSPYQDKARSLELIKTAADRGYAQAQFVMGLAYSSDMFGDLLPVDFCESAKYHLKAARWGRYASLISYSRFALKGKFDSCKEKVDWNEVAGFLDLARGAYQYDWYDGLLIDDLEELQAKTHPVVKRKQ
jgi:TPR repeat protein